MLLNYVSYWFELSWAAWHQPGWAGMPGSIRGGGAPPRPRFEVWGVQAVAGKKVLHLCCWTSQQGKRIWLSQSLHVSREWDFQDSSVGDGGGNVWRVGLRSCHQGFGVVCDSRNIFHSYIVRSLTYHSQKHFCRVHQGTLALLDPLEVQDHRYVGYI